MKVFLFSLIVFSFASTPLFAIDTRSAGGGGCANGQCFKNPLGDIFNSPPNGGYTQISPSNNQGSSAAQEQTCANGQCNMENRGPKSINYDSYAKQNMGQGICTSGTCGLGGGGGSSSAGGSGGGGCSSGTCGGSGGSGSGGSGGGGLANLNLGGLLQQSFTGGLMSGKDPGLNLNIFQGIISQITGGGLGNKLGENIIPSLPGIGGGIPSFGGGDNSGSDSNSSGNSGDSLEDEDSNTDDISSIKETDQSDSNLDCQNGECEKNDDNNDSLEKEDCSKGFCAF